MSKEKLPPEALMAQLEAIRQQISELQAYLAQLEQALGSVKTSIESIEAAGEGAEAFSPADPNMNALFKAKIESGKVYVHLGRGIYAALSKEQALEVLREREQGVLKAIESVRTDITRLTGVYSEIARRLQELQQSALAREARKG